MRLCLATISRFAILLSFFAISVSGYEIPMPKVEYLVPRGFSISIPDEDGLVFFVVHTRVNKAFSDGSTEEGDQYDEIRKPLNGRWVFENKKINIVNGDVIYFWIFVQHENLGYLKTGLQHTVEKNKMKEKLLSTTTTEKCILSKTLVNGQHACTGALIFEDEFNVLDLNKWEREIRIPLDTESSEFLSYQNRLENSFVKEGKLVIKPTLLSDLEGFTDEKIRTGKLFLQNCHSPTNNEYECKRKAMFYTILPPVISAKLNTKNYFRFQYGRIEIRAKFPKGDWIFPEIFLEPHENYYGNSDLGSGKIIVGHILANEILETKDYIQIDGARLKGGVIITNKALFRESFLKSNVADDHYGSHFHIYGMTWKPDSISFSVDGVQYSKIRNNFKNWGIAHNLTQSNLWNSNNPLSPFDKEFYVSLGVGVGGVTDFPDHCRTGTKETLKPWNNRSPKSEYMFYVNKKTWYQTWTQPELEVDYIKIYAL